MILKTKFSPRALVKSLIPYSRELFIGGLFMLLYVICWPILAWLAGRLIPAIGKGDLQQVLRVIALALIIFLVQKISQYIQDTILAIPSLKISQRIRQDLFRKIQFIKIQSLEKLSAGDITYRLTEDADRVAEVIYKTIQDTTPCIFKLIASTDIN